MTDYSIANGAFATETSLRKLLYVRQPLIKIATIWQDQSLSGAIDAENRWVYRLEMPASWTAASITFQASTDGSNFFDLYDDEGQEVTAAVNANRAVCLDYHLLFLVRYLKLRSGSASAPVAQTGARSIRVCMG